MKRRILLGGVVVVAVSLLAIGVLVPGSVLGLIVSDSAHFDADPAAPAEETVSDTGYALADADELVVDEEVAAGGITRTIVVTNHLRTYDRSIDVQGQAFDAAVFAVVSTPAVEIAGRSFNPVSEMSHRELLEQFQSELEGDYDDLDDLEQVDEHDATVLGESTTVSQFATTATAEGEAVTVYVYVTTVRSGDDIVVLVGGHPAAFAQERVSILELMHATTHPSE